MTNTIDQKWIQNYHSKATEQALETLLWSSCTVDGEPLDDYFTVDDIPEEMKAEIKSDLLDFIKCNKDALLTIETENNYDASQFGHDFILTSNGHGAGFWDRGLGEIGDKFTEQCKPYNYDLFLEPTEEMKTE